jgi:hypothetical protein
MLLMLCCVSAGNNKLFNPFADEENEGQKNAGFTFYR